MRAMMENPTLMRGMATGFAAQVANMLTGSYGTRTSIVGVLMDDPSLGGVGVSGMTPVSMDTFKGLIAANLMKIPKDARLAGVFKAYRHKIDSKTGKVMKDKDGIPVIDDDSDNEEVFVPKRYGTERMLRLVKKKIGNMDDADMAELMVMAAKALKDEFNVDMQFKCSSRFADAVKKGTDVKTMCTADGACLYKYGACIPTDVADATASKAVLAELHAARAEKALVEARAEEEREASDLEDRLNTGFDDSSSDDEE